uniref:Uncharacterized protein n=1 Tax=Oryza meridionalis TaxID=40149 RepID=A0A0E0DW84_9ORYZ
MAMERFLTSLVFCEAPGMDVFAYAGTSLTAAVNKVSTASSGGPAGLGGGAKKKDAAGKESFFAAGKAPRRLLQAAYSPAFDGLNSFETIVMH